MSAAQSSVRVAQRPRPVTLLELVQGISETTDDDREVVATVMYLLRTGRVRLCGNFRGAPPEALD